MFLFKQRKGTPSIWWVVAWVFVWALAIFDASFALYHRETITEWEMNPLVHLLGLDLMIFIKLCGLSLAQLLSIRFPILTYIALAAYTVLGGLYLALLFT
jgi:hypothetical protein